MAVCLEISSVEVSTVSQCTTWPGSLSIWLQPRPAKGERRLEALVAVKTPSWSGTLPMQKRVARFAPRQSAQIATERYLCMEENARHRRMERP